MIFSGESRPCPRVLEHLVGRPSFTEPPGLSTRAWRRAPRPALGSSSRRSAANCPIAPAMPCSRTTARATTRSSRPGALHPIPLPAAMAEHGDLVVSLDGCLELLQEADSRRARRRSRSVALRRLVAEALLEPRMFRSRSSKISPRSGPWPRPLPCRRQPPQRAWECAPVPCWSPFEGPLPCVSKYCPSRSSVRRCRRAR